MALAYETRSLVGGCRHDALQRWFLLATFKDKLCSSANTRNTLSWRIRRSDRSAVLPPACLAQSTFPPNVGPRAKQAPAGPPRLLNQGPRGGKRLGLAFLPFLLKRLEATLFRFELVGGRMASGAIGHIQRVNGEVIYVFGNLNEPENGRFFLSKADAPWSRGRVCGCGRIPGSARAYRIEPTGPAGACRFS